MLIGRWVTMYEFTPPHTNSSILHLGLSHCDRILPCPCVLQFGNIYRSFARIRRHVMGTDGEIKKLTSLAVSFNILGGCDNLSCIYMFTGVKPLQFYGQ